MIEAITFDFWNTLYKYPGDKVLHNIRINGFTQVLQSAGFKFEEQAVLDAFRFAWQHANRQQRAYGIELTPRGHMTLILQKLNSTVSEDIWNKAYHYYAETLLEYPPQLFNDVVETLRLLSSRYKMAVICNTGFNPGRVLRKLMRQDGIIDFFEYLTFSDEVDCAKPNPRIFDFTLEKINIPAINAAHIGDDMLTDVVGAKRAGMTAIWLAPDSDWKVPEADYHLRSLKELVDLW